MLKMFRARPVGLVCLAVLWLVPLAAGAVTRPVGPGDSIAVALDASAQGDTVLVSCGLYQEQGLVLPNGVVLQGESGPSGCVTIATVGGEPILTCEPSGASSQVRNITFTVDAGGLVAQVVKGGGVLLEGAHTEFYDCRFLDLEAVYGGAVYCDDASPVFTDCEFGNNSALTSGGALNCVNGAGPILGHCLLYGNSAGVTGGALNLALGSYAYLGSCTLVAHTGTALAGWAGRFVTGDVSRTIISGGDAAFVGDDTAVPSFVCSDIWGNGSDWTGLIAAQAAQANNFSADPLYCPDGTSEFAYALASSSPCAQAQNPTCGLVGARMVGCDASVGIDDRGGDDPPDDAIAPAVTRLRHSFPNPFNPHTTVRFDLRRAGPVRIRVYDAAGRLVSQLLDEHRPAGTHDVTWTGRDNAGRTVAAGVYFIRLEGDGMVDTQRVALVK